MALCGWSGRVVGLREEVAFSADFAEGELKPEMFCVRFGSEEKAAEFKTAFEKAAEVRGWRVEC